MNTIFKILIAIIFLFAVKTVSAQPGVPNPMKPFTDLTGNWESNDAILKLGEQSFKVNYFLDFTKVADGNGVAMNERCNIPGVGKLYGANLIGFDPYDGKYHWYSVDNFGTTHEHIGYFIDETHFYMEHNSQREGKNFQEKINLDWINANTVKLKLVATTDNVVEETAEGTFKRKGNGNSQ